MDVRLSLDASALVKEILPYVQNNNTVLTPHAGEFKRLFGEEPPDSLKQRVSMVEKILDRINSEGVSIEKLELLITSQNFTNFVKAVNPFGIITQDILNYYSGLLAHQILDIFELFKKYLLVILDKPSLSLNGKEPLGKLLNILESKGIDHHFDQFMDADLRNVLGHGWYWFENNEFNYIVDPKLKRTKTKTLGQLFVDMRCVSLLTASFIDNAFPSIVEIKKSDRLGNTFKESSSSKNSVF